MMELMEREKMTVYVLDGITFLPHYTLPCWVTPGFSSFNPIKLWTTSELINKGAVQGAEFLWPRRLTPYFS